MKTSKLISNYNERYSVKCVKSNRYRMQCTAQKNLKRFQVSVLGDELGIVSRGIAINGDYEEDEGKIIWKQEFGQNHVSTWRRPSKL